MATGENEWVHPYSEFEYGRFRHVRSLLLSTHRHHHHHYYHQYCNNSSPSTRTNRRAEGGAWGTEKYATLLLFLSVRERFLSLSRARSRPSYDVTRTYTCWTSFSSLSSPSVPYYPNNRSMATTSTIEIRANWAWWPCATSLIVWTNKAPCTSRCVDVNECRARSRPAARSHSLTISRSIDGSSQVSVRTRARLMTRTQTLLNASVITRTRCSSTSVRKTMSRWTPDDKASRKTLMFQLLCLVRRWSGNTARKRNLTHPGGELWGSDLRFLWSGSNVMVETHCRSSVCFFSCSAVSCSGTSRYRWINTALHERVMFNAANFSDLTRPTTAT